MHCRSPIALPNVADSHNSNRSHQRTDTPFRPMTNIRAYCWRQIVRWAVCRRDSLKIHFDAPSRFDKMNRSLSLAWNISRLRIFSPIAETVTWDAKRGSKRILYIYRITLIYSMSKLTCCIGPLAHRFWDTFDDASHRERALWYRSLVFPKIYRELNCSPGKFWEAKNISYTHFDASLHVLSGKYNLYSLEWPYVLNRAVGLSTNLSTMSIHHVKVHSMLIAVIRSVIFFFNVLEHWYHLTLKWILY